MADLLNPEDFTVTIDGKEYKYILSDFPAVEGREIIVKYPMSGLPKIGDYAVNEETMLKLMNYVAVNIGGQIIRLSTRDMINNHCPNPEALITVEAAMMVKNCSFFRDGRSHDLFDNLIQICLTKVSEILTPLSAPSSPMEKPPLQS